MTIVWKFKIVCYTMMVGEDRVSGEGGRLLDAQRDFWTLEMMEIFFTP